MRRKRAEKLMKEAFEEYQEDPRNWSFWVSLKVKPPEIYVIHGSEAYFLKVDSIFSPKPIGVGAKLRVDEDELPVNLPEYGFRRMNKEEVRRIFQHLPHRGEDISKTEFGDRMRMVEKKLGETVIRKEPIPFGPLREENELMAVGPAVFGDSLESISEKQRGLKRDLERELEKLRQREYPTYG